jgi:hypothetical protein
VQDCADARLNIRPYGPLRIHSPLSQQKNIFKKWHIFGRQNTPVNFPRFTSNSPQLHHKKPSKKHTLFPDPPQKTPQLRPFSISSHTSEISAKNPP